MENPKVSIITPSYNQAEYLEQTIVSVISQSYSNIEYIVMDGESSDGSVDVIKKYESQIAYWQSKKDGGQAAAIDEGFRHASGDIYAYLNSDDYYHPDIVKKAVQYFNEHPEIDMVCGNRVVVSSLGKQKYIRSWFNFGLKSPFIYFLITQESVFWRKELYQKVGGINPKMKFALDYDLFVRMIKNGSVGWCSDLWAYFRKHDQSKTMTEFYSTGMKEVQEVQKREFGKAIPLWKHFILFNIYRIIYVIYSIWKRPSK